MFDRRKFFKLLAQGSVGLAAEAKLGLAEDIAKWMLSPSKTIFIPPEPTVWLPEAKLYTVELKYIGDNASTPEKAIWRYLGDISSMEISYAK